MSEKEQEVEITEAMIFGGSVEMMGYDAEYDSSRELVQKVYRAMESARRDQASDSQA